MLLYPKRGRIKQYHLTFVTFAPNDPTSSRIAKAVDIYVFLYDTTLSKNPHFNFDTRK